MGGTDVSEGGPGPLFLDLIEALLSSVLGMDTSAVYLSPTVGLFATASGWLLFHNIAPRESDWSRMLNHLPDDAVFDPGESRSVTESWEMCFIPMVAAVHAQTA